MYTLHVLFLLTLLFGTIFGVFGAIIPHVDCGAILIDVFSVQGWGERVSFFLGFLGIWTLDGVGRENRLAFHLIQSRNVLVFFSGHILFPAASFSRFSSLTPGVNVPTPDLHLD